MSPNLVSDGENMEHDILSLSFFLISGQRTADSSTPGVLESQAAVPQHLLRAAARRPDPGRAGEQHREPGGVDHGPVLPRDVTNPVERQFRASPRQRRPPRRRRGHQEQDEGLPEARQPPGGRHPAHVAREERDQR